MDTTITTSTSALPTQFIRLHIKLDRNNYMFWRSQILTTVKAHGFEDVLLCDKNNIPPTDQSEESIKWHRRDQFILSWMLSSMAESMLGYASRCNHACEAWEVFESMFRSQSKARAMSLHF